MHLLIAGGDARMDAMCEAAILAGHTCDHVRTQEALCGVRDAPQAVVLPWPAAFCDGFVTGSDIKKEAIDAMIRAGVPVMGGGVRSTDFAQPTTLIDPAKDEAFLIANARLTAEGALFAMMAGEDALMGKTCLITGFGRIAQALTQRLCAMDAFVIICARNERQMLMAHRMGAHPAPLSALASVCVQADFAVNTVPARVFSREALHALPDGARLIELASPPYGADAREVQEAGVRMEVLGGLPGKYAPKAAGRALFDALVRAMDRRGREDA